MSVTVAWIFPKIGAQLGALSGATRIPPSRTWSIWAGLEMTRAERAIESIEHPNLIGSWMSCGESPHDLAFIKGPNGKIHHFAYHLEDWGAILRAGDIFSMDDVPVDIGPTRHGITRGTTIYFFDPAGNRNEGVRRPGLPGAPRLPDDQLDSRPARQGHLLPRPRVEAFTSVFT